MVQDYVFFDRSQFYVFGMSGLCDMTKCFMMMHVVAGRAVMMVRMMVMHRMMNGRLDGGASFLRRNRRRLYGLRLNGHRLNRCYGRCNRFRERCGGGSTMTRFAIMRHM